MKPCPGPRPADGASRPPAVTTSPPRWEIGVYAAGALALLGVAAVSLWKLWRSGTYPAPSPFPNYDYRYLQQKYGAAHSDAKHKVKGRQVWLASFPFATREVLGGAKILPASSRWGETHRQGAGAAGGLGVNAEL